MGLNEAVKLLSDTARGRPALIQELAAAIKAVGCQCKQKRLVDAITAISPDIGEQVKGIVQSNSGAH